MSSHRSRKRQTQLTLTPVPTSSPARATQPDAVRDRVAFVTVDDSPHPRKKQRTLRAIPPTPKPSAEVVDDPVPSSRKSTTLTMSSNPHFMHASVTTSTPKRQKKHVVVISDDSDSEVEGFTMPSSMQQSSPLKPPSSPPKSSRKRARRTVVESDSAEDDEPVPNKKSRLQEDGSDDELALSSGELARRQPANPEANSDEEEDDLPISNRRSAHKSKAFRKQAKPSRKLKSRRLSSSNEDTDEDDDDLKVTEKSRSQRDQADLDSDLEFLADGDNSASLHAPTSSKKQSRLSKLDELKALREGRQSQQSQQTSTHPNSSSSARKPRRISDSEDENEIENVEDELDDDAVEGVIDDDDFVVEDGEDYVPVALPGAFSRYNKEKPKELFKYVVEWMVSKKINPAFAMTDEVYDIAFRRLDDFVKGLGGSKFHSSAWTAGFGKSLNSRPTLEDTHVGGSIMHDRCDACNRSGHPATWQVRFQGKLYDKHTLEQEEEEDSDSDSGRTPDIPPEDTVYYIGKFCMRNARTAHALAHWKFQLNEWVVDHLKEIRELAPAKIIERDGWSTKKRRKDAERIVDEMERTGEIKRLHRDFKGEIDAAQFANTTAARHARDVSP